MYIPDFFVIILFPPAIRYRTASIDSIIWFTMSYFQKRPLILSDTVKLDEWLNEHGDNCVCLGECGLDFSRWLCPTSNERDGQRDALRAQVHAIMYDGTT